MKNGYKVNGDTASGYVSSDGACGSRNTTCEGVKRLEEVDVRLMSGLPKNTRESKCDWQQATAEYNSDDILYL